jgi:chromosome segregation ATPase
MNKKFILGLLSVTLLLFTAVGCKTAAEKEADAANNVENAKEDLSNAKKETITEAQTQASDAEWKIFKNNAETTIKNNEIRIAALRVKMTKSGQKLDAEYAKKIDAMQTQNQTLKARIDKYDKERSNWSAFKTEFGKDMDELGQALAGFVTN